VRESMVDGGHAFNRPPPSSWVGELPQPILLGCTGLLAITALVVGAIGLRTFVGGLEGSGPSPAKSAVAVAPSGAPTGRGAATTEAAPPDAAAVRAARAKVQSDLQTGRYAAFVSDLDDLLRLDPSAASERELRSAVLDVLMVITAGNGDLAAKLFESIEQRMGTHGIDLLYELMTTRGGSRAAKRATQLLADPEVRERGTPALRVAYELRSAPCPQKNDLFERAKEDGDRRTLGQLEMLKDCRRGGCCNHTKDPALREAIDALRARHP